MRFSRVILSASAAVLLSACASIHDDPSKHSDVNNWMNARPSKLEEKTGYRWPSGYAGQNEQNARELRSRDGTVSVFPVGDVAPAPEAFPSPVVMTPPAPVMTQDNYGQMMLQLFYLHGSAALTAGERQQIVNVAKNVSPSQPVSLTVVGHASKRVDGVDDPVQKKMINFEMAQKRANVVTEVLTSSGVNPSWVQAISKGDEEANAVPGSRDQESADRRVEIYKK